MKLFRFVWSLRRVVGKCSSGHQQCSTLTAETLVLAENSGLAKKLLFSKIKATSKNLAPQEIGDEAINSAVERAEVAMEELAPRIIYHRTIGGSHDSCGCD